MLNVTRKRSWRIDPYNPEADKHGEVLKAVEESIGRIPKRAWYDAWVRHVEQQGVVPVGFEPTTLWLLEFQKML